MKTGRNREYEVMTKEPNPNPTPNPNPIPNPNPNPVPIPNPNPNPNEVMTKEHYNSLIGQKRLWVAGEREALLDALCTRDGTGKD